MVSNVNTGKQTPPFPGIVCVWGGYWLPAFPLPVKLEPAINVDMVNDEKNVVVFCFR